MGNYLNRFAPESRLRVLRSILELVTIGDGMVVAEVPQRSPSRPGSRSNTIFGVRAIEYDSSLRDRLQISNEQYSRVALLDRNTTLDVQWFATLTSPDERRNYKHECRKLAEQVTTNYEMALMWDSGENDERVVDERDS